MLEPVVMIRAGLIAVVLFFCGACANTTAATPPPNEVTNDPSLVRLSPNPSEENSPKQLRSVSLQSDQRRLRCFAGTTGKVNVVVTRHDNAILLGFEPGVSLDPTVRDCLLETLSTYDLEDTGSNVGGTSIPPTGYTSIIQVSW